MRVNVVCAALVVMLVGCTVGSPGDGSAQPPPASEVQPPEQETDDDGATVARTEVELRGRCRGLPRQTADGYALVANLDVVNTGNVGVNVKITTTWPRTPRARVSTYRRVSVEQGQSTPVEMRLPISADEADGVQRAAAKGRRCINRHRITGAFGTPSG